METIIEQQRRLHEEKERLMEAMKKEALHSKSALRETINSDHRTKILLDKYIHVSSTIMELHKDKDGLRKEEIQAIAGPNEFQEFYRHLKEIKDFHRKHPDEIFVPMSVEFDELDKIREETTDEVVNMVEFSDEESYGRFLDLHECYLKYINLKGIEKVSYVAYLDDFDKLAEVPKQVKNSIYKDYLGSLLNYLVSYTHRLKPLLDTDEVISNLQTSFDEKWASGEFIGWQKEAGSAMAHTGAHLDLSAFTSSEELVSLGLDRLKSALMALNLKCGGSVEQRAERLFMTKGKKIDQLPANLFVKSKVDKQGQRQKYKSTAWLEAQVYKLVEILDEQRQATKENVQRRQARTDAEREEEGDDNASDNESDDDDDELIYNPKNPPWMGRQTYPVLVV